MRFSEAWLREWVSPPVDTQQLADQLSMAGLEVDAVEPAAPVFNGVTIGLVQGIAPHPDAAKLRICTLDVGQGDPLQIICGAANVAEGMRVPVATIGAVLPGDFKIKKAKLRGIESFGMICSASELGLAESSDGILPLPVDAPIGEDFRRWLSLDDHCIEVDLTPDRGDCLSLAGLAREVGVINRVPLTAPVIESVAPASDERFPVQLLAPEACPRYLCRGIRNIDASAETPMWMQERLRRSGLRTISPVVDVTNYVLLELGQPMHGFDLGKLAGEIRVRMAEAGEKLALLNGETVTLRADTLVIADAEKPVAMAGIMGGSDSGVSEGTRDILLESAFFAPIAISGKARSYGLHTDSSHRFERGVDPDLQATALERATRLLLDIVGGEPGPIVEACSDSHRPKREPLHLRERRVTQILGLALPAETIVDILERLGMRLERLDDGWRVTPPSARFDLLMEVDLIADIGRIHGYNEIPVTHASAASATKAPPETAFDLDRARLALVDRGFHEVITYSFVSPEMQALVAPDAETLKLANPLSSELSVMRTSLWSGLLQAATYNQSRQMERVRIFESGLRFRSTDDGLDQTPGLGGLILGARLSEQWGEPSSTTDFYDLKADVEAVLGLTGALEQFRFVATTHPALHPGQTAAIERDGQAVGVIGMLHPLLAKKLDLDGDVFLFELDLEPIAKGVLPKFEKISRFPSIRRDIALVVDASVTFEAVADCVRAAASDLLKDIILFDVYTGENVETGRKSLALGLILQSSSQTLEDNIIETTVGRIVTSLTTQIGARLRD
ncbi:phenylalanine--tRNA ligase subunit beta [Thiorhodococcus mannitoliphagus]|uniref:Phenylalanine--tRNA ligase beta subunit n=1 Tax=Thiorhodococcus mannitoliphagus TaxID=329406 RepID=A0A6P1DX68_9GAMM|nr:phenylalanine--tRNA ligase subunit beta [Thiorhodococcus mannitoliphagus]NEX20304.1 phenylalanine--tRNA ligase subunit beta [Thiorhodococcus mannitoliphagus]